MEVEILQWLATNILGQPAILLGIIIALGLILQKKSSADIVTGTGRGIIGFILMTTGAGVFVAGLGSFSATVGGAFRIPGVTWPGIPLGEFIGTYGSYAAMVMTLAFIVHVILARITPLKYVYLTGHLMWWVALTVVATIVQIEPDATLPQILGIGTVVMALYWTLQPAYMHRYMKIVTGKDEIAYGHTSSSGCFLSAVFGKFVGKPEESTEKITFPKSVGFLKDYAISTIVIIGAIMILCAIAAGPAILAPYAGDLNYIVWAFLEACKFAAGIVILLTGVAMFIHEIIPAFKGISTKVIPGSRPALDCPVIFPYAPAAVMLGFVSATIVFLILMVIFAATGFAIIVPPMIMLFFPGGACGVYGNSVGGWKGAVLGGLINGAFLAIGQAVTKPLLAASASELAALADPDWYIIIWILLPILRLIFGS